MSEVLNGYTLSRHWFDFCFENPEKIKPIHSAIFCFAIEHNNRLGWREKFGFPSQMVMDALGIKNWKTYSNALNNIVEFGFIIMIEKSRNQYSANIISLKVAYVKNTKALSKAMTKHSTKHYPKHVRGTVSIDKPINQLTIKPENQNSSLQIIKDDTVFWEQFQMKYKNQISEWKKMLELFELKVDEEKMDYDLKILKARIQRFAIHWQSNQKNNSFTNQKTTDYVGNR